MYIYFFCYISSTSLDSSTMCRHIGFSFKCLIRFFLVCVDVDLIRLNFIFMFFRCFVICLFYFRYRFLFYSFFVGCFLFFQQQQKNIPIFIFTGWLSSNLYTYSSRSVCWFLLGLFHIKIYLLCLCSIVWRWMRLQNVDK